MGMGKNFPISPWTRIAWARPAAARSLIKRRRLARALLLAGLGGGSEGGSSTGEALYGARPAVTTGSVPTVRAAGWRRRLCRTRRRAR